MTTRKVKLELHFIWITCFMILFAFVSFHFDWKLLLYSSTSLVEKNSSTTTITWNEKERMQHRKHSLEFNYHEISLLCNQTNDIVTTVRQRALLSDEREASRWDPNATFQLLTCDQLIQSLPLKLLKHGTTNNNNTVERHDVTASNIFSSSLVGDDTSTNISFELMNLISLQRLAEKLNKPSITVVVIGGSVTTGVRDDLDETDDDDDTDDEVDDDDENDDDYYDYDTYNIAYPKKLEDFLQYLLPHKTIKLVNLAEGGADEETWLGKLDHIMEFDPDVILVESAVNDQCDYHKQDQQIEFVNRTSFSLLNILMNFPQRPAVISVELFRMAYLDEDDADSHCTDHVHELKSDPGCFYCPQWWKPQTWRQEARTYNSVSHASYRDAVWPILKKPPEKLCSEYWNGLSHPQIGVHVMVASTILFQFLVVMEKSSVLRQQLQKNAMDGGLKMIDIPKNICLSHITSYRAMQGNANDPFGNDISYTDSCWGFRADVRNKYGWVCEVVNDTGISGGEYLHLSKKIRIGGDRKLIISRLVSYDDRMAIAQVWLTGSRTDHISTNIFIGDHVWNITSWHGKLTSIPQPRTIQLGKLKFKQSVDMQWPAKDDVFVGTGADDMESSTVEVTFNIKVITGSSRSASDPKIDKFKLLGIVTC